jgi:hypothetical protein
MGIASRPARFPTRVRNEVYSYIAVLLGHHGTRKIGDDADCFRTKKYRYDLVMIMKHEGGRVSQYRNNSAVNETKKSTERITPLFQTHD